MARLIPVTLVSFERRGILEPEFGDSAVREARRKKRRARRGNRRERRIERNEDKARELEAETRKTRKTRRQADRKPERRDVRRDAQPARSAAGPAARPDWERGWRPLEPRREAEAEAWADQAEPMSWDELDEEFEEAADLEDIEPEDEFEGRRARWGAAMPLGRRMRLRVREGHRAAVMEWQPGLYIVAEVPERVARREERRVEMGLVPLVPLLVKGAINRAVQRQGEQATPAPAPVSPPTPAPAATVSLPIISGAPRALGVYASLGWARDPEVGCKQCNGRCGRR